MNEIAHFVHIAASPIESDGRNDCSEMVLDVCLNTLECDFIVTMVKNLGAGCVAEIKDCLEIVLDVCLNTRECDVIVTRVKNLSGGGGGTKIKNF